MDQVMLWMTSIRATRNIRIIVLTLSFSGTLLCSVFSQKQLVFLKHGNVVARFSEGSYFKCILKNSNPKQGIIIKLNEFSMVTSQDTIAFLSIGKVDFKSQHHFRVQSGIGGLFLLGGLAYLIVDGANKTFGYSTGGFDQGDAYALAFAGAGAAMVFIKPRYLRLSKGLIIRTIDRDSQYYQ